MRNRLVAPRFAILALVIGALGLSRGAGAQTVRPPAAGPAVPADVRQVLEGTWTLEEWHVDGVVMKPPEMTGRWMVHDGVVMAIRHRDGPKSFESTAAWGSYTVLLYAPDGGLLRKYRKVSPQP